MGKFQLPAWKYKISTQRFKCRSRFRGLISTKSTQPSWNPETPVEETAACSPVGGILGSTRGLLVFIYTDLLLPAKGLLFRTRVICFLFMPCTRFLPGLGKKYNVCKQLSLAWHSSLPIMQLSFL